MKKLKLRKNNNTLEDLLDKGCFCVTSCGGDVLSCIKLNNSEGVIIASFSQSNLILEIKLMFSSINHSTVFKKIGKFDCVFSTHEYVKSNMLWEPNELAEIIKCFE